MTEASKATFWCLYREPFRGYPLTAWFKSEGFRAPRRDETLVKNLVTFSSSTEAERVVKTLLQMRSVFGPALVIRRSHLIRKLRANATS